jgi:glycosyltransferase involved in cell wall biosynthesis
MIDRVSLRLAVVEPTPLGGLLHYATQLADALADRGNDVDLIVTRDQELAGLAGPARRREVLAAAPRGTAGGALVRRARTAGRLTASWTRIAREVRRGHYDAVLVNGSLDLALTAAGALAVNAAKGSTPVAHVCHNVRPFDRWGGGGLYAGSRATLALLRRAYPSFDLLFVHGETSRRELLETWRPARVEVIPHGDERIFAGEPPAPAAEPRILFFGAWRKMKGLPVLMEAFDELAERRPQVRLTIAGPTVPEEGEDRHVLAWAAERRDRVEVRPGYVPVGDVAPLFAQARVVALPYLAAYQSGVAHLAMTMERAVVATEVGDLPSAVRHGRTGLVVAPRDPAALAAALEDVVTDATLAERLGREGRRVVMNGSGWPSVAAQVETALRELVERPPSTSREERP